MEQKNGLSFNCAESVLIGVQKDHSVPGCQTSCMKVASVLGGGIAGSGEVCGAASGGVICLGLSGGTNGNETPDTFKDKRGEIRLVVRGFLKNFEDSWGSVRCSDLIAMDKGEQNSVGTQREKDGTIRNHCDDYVKWSTKKIIHLLEDWEKTNPT
ncbi:MAG: C-GCAxxG-C-C family (seleno)protein [Candidatus Thorarchaeota archaeon]